MPLHPLIESRIPVSTSKTGTPVILLVRDGCATSGSGSPRRLIDQGEAFGYQVELTKSIIIVSPNLVQQATDIFGDLNIKVAATYTRSLEGCIGEPDGVKSVCPGESGDVGEQCQLPCRCCQEVSSVRVLCAESISIM